MTLGRHPIQSSDRGEDSRYQAFLHNWVRNTREEDGRKDFDKTEYSINNLLQVWFERDNNVFCVCE